MHAALLTPCSLLYPPKTISACPPHLPSRPCSGPGVSRARCRLHAWAGKFLGQFPEAVIIPRLPTPPWPAASLSVLPWRGMCVARESSTAEVPWRRARLFPPLCCHGDSARSPSPPVAVAMGRKDEPRWRLRSPRQHLFSVAMAAAPSHHPALPRRHGNNPAPHRLAPLLRQQHRCHRSRKRDRGAEPHAWKRA